MGELKYKPTGYSYCVDDNVWAGEYPVWEWEQSARIRQLKLFTDFGINYFLDLTENGEMPPYAPFLVNSIGRHTFPIPNGCVSNSVTAPETEAQVNFIREFANTYQQWK